METVLLHTITIPVKHFIWVNAGIHTWAAIVPWPDASRLEFLLHFSQICLVTSNTTLALANMGTEKIYIDSSSGEVFVQYIGPAET